MSGNHATWPRSRPVLVSGVEQGCRSLIPRITARSSERSPITLQVQRRLANMHLQVAYHACATGPGRARLTLALSEQRSCVKSPAAPRGMQQHEHAMLGDWIEVRHVLHGDEEPLPENSLDCFEAGTAARRPHKTRWNGHVENLLYDHGRQMESGRHRTLLDPPAKSLLIDVRMSLQQPGNIPRGLETIPEHVRCGVHQRVKNHPFSIERREGPILRQHLCMLHHFALGKAPERRHDARMYLDRQTIHRDGRQMMRPGSTPR